VGMKFFFLRRSVVSFSFFLEDTSCMICQVTIGTFGVLERVLKILEHAKLLILNNKVKICSNVPMFQRFLNEPG
jgi:hypothetical protein